MNFEINKKLNGADLSQKEIGKMEEAPELKGSPAALEAEMADEDFGDMIREEGLFNSGERVFENKAAALETKDVSFRGADVSDGDTIEHGYTPAQCARISSGTQVYCPFAGSGR